MMKLRMRTKFLLSMLLISAGLTCDSLLLVRHTVQAQVRKSIFADLHNSVTTYQNFHREREITLTHLAELLADLPNLRALMTTQHEATIQDRVYGFVAAGGQRPVCAGGPDRQSSCAAHGNSRFFTGDGAAVAESSIEPEGSGQWWFGAQHLYQVFLKPIYAGPAAENNCWDFWSSVTKSTIRWRRK